ncbi:MAG TPA: response regulator transcription factor [Chloroflexia bacterium]|nr:response regulator transcription factor [Chloroflexia bacterium]
MLVIDDPVKQNKEMENPRILVVDDESNILDVLELYLLREGYKVERASDGNSALKLYHEHKPDLVILDVMLPQVGGMEVLRQIRAQASRPGSRIVPVIMLTAKTQEDDKLAGLEGGADDYITKPFSPRELVARVKVALRRVQEAGRVTNVLSPGDEIMTGEGLYINRIARSVQLKDQPVELTAKEFDLLWFLASNPGQVFTREQLLDKVWDYTFFGEMSTVTVHVRRLREKVEIDPVRPRHIKTVWGVGYKFEP